MNVPEVVVCAEITFDNLSGACRATGLVGKMAVDAERVVMDNWGAIGIECGGGGNLSRRADLSGGVR